MLNGNASWEPDSTYANRNAFKKYGKKHRAEYESCFENLDRVVGLLNQGHRWGSFQIGCLRSEGDGLYRIGQTGIAHAKETRLYIYAFEIGCRIYLLTIGDKDSQEDDIKESKSKILEIREEHKS